MLKNENSARTVPEEACGLSVLTFVVDHLAGRAGELSQSDLDVATSVISLLARHVSPQMRLAAAETLRAAGSIPVSVFAGLVVETNGRSAAQASGSAHHCGIGQLLAMARQAEVPEATSNLIVARGMAEALVVVAANPGAVFAKSSLTTLVELAASDFSLREALCTRGDLPDAILDRLWPFLSIRAKVKVLSAGLTLDAAAATELMNAAEQDMVTTMRAGDLPLGVDTCLAHIEAGRWSLTEGVKALASEGRVVDVASLLARRAGLSVHTALALLLGSYDRGCVALARAVEADAAALALIIDVRAKAGARRTADRRGPTHAFSSMSLIEAEELAGSVTLPSDDGPASLMADDTSRVGIAA
jgi:uncharacterized protein (DUF2336 family)